MRSRQVPRRSPSFTPKANRLAPAEHPHRAHLLPAHLSRRVTGQDDVRQSFDGHAGRASQVWLGAAAAFAVHVVIATTLGVALFAVLPRRAIDGVVAAMFLFGAVYAWLEGAKAHEEHDVEAQPKHGVVVTAFIVIFLAEWGDSTQVLTANLAAKYGSPLSVGVGAFVALLAVAAIAVASGQALLRVLNIATIRKVTAAVLLALSAFSLWTAVR